MSELVIETTDLHKEFRGRRGGRRVAVAGLDLAVPTGGVHGFLGPNGSGKTTTIRMLLGLARATRGQMRLFGQPVPSLLPSVIGRVGAVVESPKFSPNLSRASEPPAARPLHRGRRRAGGRRGRDGRPHGARPGPVQVLLARA